LTVCFAFRFSQKLDLVHVGMRCGDVMVLCEWLKKSDAVKEVNLERNEIRSGGLRYLGYMLLVNRSIERLSVRKNPCCHGHMTMDDHEIFALYASSGHFITQLVKCAPPLIPQQLRGIIDAERSQDSL
jgi:hypothetical protein